MFEKFLVVHELSHFAVAVFLSFFFLRLRTLQPKRLILIIFLVTFLMDLDHLFDFFYFAGNFNFWEYFGNIDFFASSGKVFVLIHSWELVIFLAVLGKLKRAPVFWAISAAIGGHLLIDQLSYTPNPLAYFLIFRAAASFSLAWFNGF